MFTKRITPVYSLGSSRPIFTTQYSIDNEILFLLEVIKNDTKIWPAILDLLYYLTEKLFIADFMLQLGDVDKTHNPAEELHIYLPRIQKKYLYGVIEPGVHSWEQRWHRPAACYLAAPHENRRLTLRLSAVEVEALPGKHRIREDVESAYLGFNSVYWFMRDGFMWTVRACSSWDWHSKRTVPICAIHGWSISPKSSRTTTAE